MKSAVKVFIIGMIRKWGVAVLLLAGLVAGVIMLAMKEDDLYDSPEEAAAAAALKRRQAMGYGAYPPRAPTRTAVTTTKRAAITPRTAATIRPSRPRRTPRFRLLPSSS